MLLHLSALCCTGCITCALYTAHIHMKCMGVPKCVQESTHNWMSFRNLQWSRDYGRLYQVYFAKHFVFVDLVLPCCMVTTEVFVNFSLQLLPQTTIRASLGYSTPCGNKLNEGGKTAPESVASTWLESKPHSYSSFKVLIKGRMENTVESHASFKALIWTRPVCCWLFPLCACEEDESMERRGSVQCPLLWEAHWCTSIISCITLYKDRARFVCVESSVLKSSKGLPLETVLLPTAPVYCLSV